MANHNSAAAPNINAPARPTWTLFASALLVKTAGFDVFVPETDAPPRVEFPAG
jgi:hypothetical protein